MEDNTHKIQELLIKEKKFIEDMEKLHTKPDGTQKYDYSKVKYISNIDKVIINCPTHGDFLQSPKKHKAGQGCNKCGILKRTEGRKSNKEQFTEKAIEVHHDSTGKALFNYDLVNYIDCGTPVTIKCLKEGHLFDQTPTSHLQGNGCKFCSGCYKRDTANFIERSERIHVNEKGETLYDYSEVEYKDSNTKVKIKCKKNKEHIFWQTPGHHLYGHGCDSCARNIYIMSTEQFNEKAKQIHGDKYDYSETEFKGLCEYVTIVCPTHGPFNQIALYHTTNGRGCFHCGIEKVSIESRKTVDEFIEDSQQIHSIVKYDYSRVYEDYETRRSKVKIGCLKCKTFFTQRCSDHLQGYGCKNCKNKTQQIFYAYLREQFGEDFFETEKKFDECKFVNHLPFDFYSREHNLIIELDGRQHFVETGIFRDTLAERQFKDFIKMKYLQENNISLIRIFQEDVLENRNNWKAKILSSVQNYETPRFIYLSSKNNYEDYQQKYNEFLAKNIRIEDLSRIVRLEESDGAGALTLQHSGGSEESEKFDDYEESDEFEGAGASQSS